MHSNLKSQVVNTSKNTEIKIISNEAAPFDKNSPEGQLAYKIYMARCRLRWSQLDVMELANAFGTVFLTQQRISEIERAVVRPTFLEVCAIAKAMRCQLVEFDV